MITDFAVKVLDTANPTAAASDTGQTQTMKAGWLAKDKPLRISVDLGSGDTVVVETKSVAAEDFEIIKTFTSETPADIYVSRFWRMRRTVDGGGESQGFVENPTGEKMWEDSAT